MRDLTLLRLTTSDHGTFGGIYDEEGHRICGTLEPPWRGNKIKLSCIPDGPYHVALTASPRFGTVYMLHSVPGRSHVLIHRGNLGGDVTKNLISHTEGCILLGSYQGELHNQKALLSSAPAFSKFMREMDGEDFILTIRSASEDHNEGDTP